MSDFLTIIQENLIGLSIIIGGFFIYIITYISTRPLRDDEKCRQVIEQYSKTFYKAFSKVKNKHKRKAIYAVYAFCRRADDVVDIDKDKIKLEKLTRELDMFVTKGKTPNFMWRSLKRHTKTYYQGFDYKPFYDMIKGQEMDLDFKVYETLEDLLDYCYHVAGTVGLMLTPILSFEEKDNLIDFSINLGYAMQITNILRDIGEDYRNGRVYLPQSMMAQANYKHEDLSSGKINDRFIGLFEKLAKVAEDHFDQSLKDINLFKEDAKLPLALSIILYRAILDQVRENGYDVFKKRAVVSDEKKKAIIENYLKKGA